MSIIPISNDHVSLNWETVQAYAETCITRSMVVYPESIEGCIGVVDYCKKEGLTICPKGAGFSYGDMILNDQQVILDTSRMNRIIRWGDETGLMVVEPGVRFADIFKAALLSNWTLDSCPGGMEVTIGGAVSNNVHGKDSWKNGNFGDQVLEFKLLTAKGDILSVNRESNKNLFKATVGGMGMMGVIVEVTLQLKRVPSAFVEVSSFSVMNIEESLEILEKTRDNSDFSVAWVDAFADGSSIGRGFVATAKWIDAEIDLHEQRLADSLNIPTRIFGLLPARPVWFLARPVFRPWAIKYINKLNFYTSKLRNSSNNPTGESMLFTEYNFMHNKIPDLKHVYRPQGFLEFQPLIPRTGGVNAIEELLRLCKYYKCQSLLCGLKLHKADDYNISYSGDGYSVGVDIQIAGRDRDNIRQFADAIFNYTLDCGGKVYLAKDELLSREAFIKMYPGVREFLQTKNEIDPSGVFQSDMYRRLLK